MNSCVDVLVSWIVPLFSICLFLVFFSYPLLLAHSIDNSIRLRETFLFGFVLSVHCFSLLHLSIGGRGCPYDQLYDWGRVNGSPVGCITGIRWICRAWRRDGSNRRRKKKKKTGWLVFQTNRLLISCSFVLTLSDHGLHTSAEMLVKSEFDFCRDHRPSPPSLHPVLSFFFFGGE